MSVKKYLTFIKIVETGSLTRAAELLGHTQSGVTQLIHSLEEELGVRLMNRSRAGITLTEEGKKLYPYFLEVVEADRRLQKAISDLNNQEEHLIKLGAFTSVAVNWLPDIIRAYQSFEPDIRFEVIDCGYNNIEQELTAHKMDFGFVPLPLSGDYKCISLYRDRLLAVLPSNHPILSKRTCPVSLFETEPVISLIGSIDRDAQTVFTASSITPNIRFTTEDDYAMLAMVEKGLGICIVPELMLTGNQMKIQAMELDPPAARTIGIAFPSYQTLSPAAKRFADFVTEWVPKHGHDLIDRRLI